VLLHHKLPDGSSHFDWLIARDGDESGTGAGPVITFRVPERVDGRGAPGPMLVDRLTDHRPLYLTYEGPVAGGRGAVERLATGSCRVLIEGSDRLVVEADFGGGARQWTCIQHVEDDPAQVVRRWRLESA
jgi:hypothetical protein